MSIKHGRYIGFLLASALLATTVAKKHKAQPNIVMIVADDLGWDDVSFHGSSQIPTPHIDKLANEGVILNNYYVSPICTPTRASFMTGRHPVNLGIQHGTVFGTQPYGLPLGEITTPQYMKSLGYSTHGIGKWHLGFFQKEYTPTYRGFDSFYGYWNGKEDYWDHSSQEDVWGFDLRDDQKPVKNETGHYSTELFTKRAVQIIHTHDKSKPLYLYLAQQAVHSANEREPLQAPKKLINKFPNIDFYDRQVYAAMVTALDESVGNVYKALKKSKILDNTVLVFTTDNGGAPRGFNWNQGCNYPLKGGKDSFWEGGVRAVGFVHSNLLKKAARVSTNMIDATDWLPTFYHLGGGDVSRIQDRIDGMNVWDSISLDSPSPRSEILHNIDPIRKFAAIRVNNYKLIVNQDAVYKQTWHPRYTEQSHEQDDEKALKTLPGAVVDCGRRSARKGKACNTTEFPCLFDISKDPCEYNTIASENLFVVRKLLERLIQIQRHARPVWFPERDPTADPNSFDGFWGPWEKNPANTKILHDAMETIPTSFSKKDCCRSNTTADCCVTRKHSNQSSAVYRGDLGMHSLLHDMLPHAKAKKNIDKKVKDRNKDKKTTISKDDETMIQESMKRLLHEMDLKTHNKEGKSKIKHSTKKEHHKNTQDVGKKRAKRWAPIQRKPDSGISPSDVDSVRAIVRQSIGETTASRHQSAFSNIINDIEGNSKVFFAHSKARKIPKTQDNHHRRSGIPKPQKTDRKETILSALTEIFE